MTILGIETSCDETAAAVWRDGRLASNVIASQEVHHKYGGVIPELASRAHVRAILPIVDSALERAAVQKEDITAIAVTYGPGLAGSLLVGLNFAKAMALVLRVPIIGVNHIEGHIFSNWIEHPELRPPFISLIVSGGHTQLVLVKDWGEYEILGRTRDDAVGEAFDKVAKMLDLPYPGGPAIDKLAKTGDASYLKLPKGKVKDNEFAFSYSGLKTAVLYHLQSTGEQERNRHKADIAASFQVAAIAVLLEKSALAVEKFGLHQLAVAGGVACNSHLRLRLEEESRRRGFEAFYPSPILCTDNAAMIARAGAFYLEMKKISDFELAPRPSLKL